MTITIWPTRHQSAGGFAAYINENKSLRSWAETAIGSVYNLMTDAKSQNLSDDFMDYKISVKASPPEDAHCT